MSKELVCFVDPFTIDWRVVDTDEPWERRYLSIEDFLKALDLCEERGASTFRIVGPEEYATELAELLNKTQMTEYKECKVKVEVN